MIAIYLAISLLVPLVPLLAARAYGFAPGLGPLVLVAITLFLGVPVKIAYTYLFASDLSAPWLQRPDAWVEFALVYILLFSVLTTVGYLLAIRREDRFTAAPLLARQAVGPQATLTLVVISIAMFVIVILLLQSRKAGFGDLADLASVDAIANFNQSKIDRISRTAGFGKTHAFFFAFLAVLWFSFIVLACSALSDNRRRGHVIAVGMLLLLVLIEALLRGKRLALVNIFLFFTIACFIVRGHLSRRMLLGLIAAVPVMLGIFTVMSVFRHFGASTGSIDTAEATRIAVAQIFGSTYFTDINNLATVMWRMDGRELLGGESFTRLLIAFIPREIWADKPAISLGIFVRAEIYGVVRGMGGINTPMPTEAYLNFGWFGALIGLVYGFALRRFEVWCLTERNIRRFGSAWLYIFMILPLTWGMMQTTFALAMTGAIVACVVGLAIGLPVARTALGPGERARPAVAPPGSRDPAGGEADGLSTPAE